MRKLVIVAAVQVAACGGGSVPLVDYAAVARDAQCNHLVTCGVIESVEVCRTANIGFDFKLNGLDLRLSASRAAAIEMSLTRYDGENAFDCLDALGTRGCDPTSEDARAVPDACLAIFNGMQPADAGCALDEHCISRNCEITECEAACCIGTCVGDSPPVRAKLGESCEVAACENDLYCDKPTATCIALKSQGGFCVSIAECNFGLYCDSSGECAGGLSELGEACSGPCREEGTQCSATSRICVEVAFVGEPCNMSSDCSPFYTCDANKRCSPGLALDEPCSSGQRCAGDGAFCDIPFGEFMGTCARPKADGQPCQGDPACQSGTCDLATRRCVPEPVCT